MCPGEQKLPVQYLDGPLCPSFLCRPISVVPRWLFDTGILSLNMNHFAYALHHFHLWGCWPTVGMKQNCLGKLTEHILFTVQPTMQYYLFESLLHNSMHCYIPKVTIGGGNLRPNGLLTFVSFLCSYGSCERGIPPKPALMYNTWDRTKPCMDLVGNWGNDREQW